jgi:hypothetical protein
MKEIKDIILAHTKAKEKGLKSALATFVWKEQ